MAFFPFSSRMESFFGDLYGQGLDAVEFFKRMKTVIERWPKERTRKSRETQVRGPGKHNDWQERLRQAQAH